MVHKNNKSENSKYNCVSQITYCEFWAEHSDDPEDKWCDGGAKVASHKHHGVCCVESPDRYLVRQTVKHIGQTDGEAHVYHAGSNGDDREVLEHSDRGQADAGDNKSQRKHFVFEYLK